MKENAAKVVFWGVRGSTPTLERDAWPYGGNTPCVEVMAPGGTRFILDCGTGIRMLGKNLVAQANRRGSDQGNSGTEAHILVTHYHWDHIQGIPFFHPFFQAQNRFSFYSFQSKQLGRNSLRQVFETQVARPYFPVDVAAMTAARMFREVAGGDKWTIEGTRIAATSLYHPQGCLGYRLDTSAGSIVYATDNEPGSVEHDENLRELADGADMLIYDAQYSPEQVASTRKGWGHSSWLEGVKIVRECKARTLVLFHHDPDSSSRIVDGFLSAARAEFSNTWAAMEGMTLTLRAGEVNVLLPESRLGQRRRLKYAATVMGESEDGRKFKEKGTVRELSLQGALLSLRSRPRLQSELWVTLEGGAARDRSKPIPLRATVVHCGAGSEKNQHGVGIVFVEDAEIEPPRG